MIDPTEFVGLEGVAHLCAGGEAPFLRKHAEAFARFAADKGDGMAGRERFFDVAATAKRLAAARIGVAPEQIAFLAHASAGLNQTAHAIDWHPDDNVVVADLEFPSCVVPFAALGDRGVTLRRVAARDHYVPLEAIEAAVDDRTRLIVASQVSYLTGQRLDMAALSGIARRHGALLAIDATHALGLAPVDATLCDFLVCSCYKWLLATHGVALFVCRADWLPEITPATLGWHNTRARQGTPSAPLSFPDDGSRFEAGNPAFLPIYMLESALTRLAQIDPRESLEHALSLCDEVVAGLGERGYQVITPVARDERAGNVCFLADDARDVVERLAARGVLVWGGEGRVRVSLHAYNGDGDVARLFDVLPVAR